VSHSLCLFVCHHLTELMKRFCEGMNVMYVGRYIASVTATISVSAVSNTNVMACKFQKFVH
jgi:ABC-type sugar transport system ATPase subunit